MKNIKVKPDSVGEEAADLKHLFCSRQAPRARPRDRENGSRYVAAFRKRDVDPPEWIEVTFVAKDRTAATQHAKRTVKPIPGLVFEGVSQW